MSELLLMLDIGDRKVAIEAARVQSVIELEEIYPVPRAPDFVVGLTAMRSRSLTVIDSRLAIGLSGATNVGERAAVVDIDGHLYALLADEVSDVSEAKSNITPVSCGFGKEWERVSKGMIETNIGPVLLINVNALISGLVAAAA